MVFIGVGGNYTITSLAFLPPPSPQVAIPLDWGGATFELMHHCQLYMGSQTLGYY